MRFAFVTVGDPGRLTGGYLYHREVFARLRARGVEIDEVVAAPAGLDEQLAAAERFCTGFDPAPYDALVVDALARVVCAPALDRWRTLRPLVAMVHELPSVAAGSADPVEQAREAPLLRADRLITVSDDGARILVAHGVVPERIVVASGGFDRLATVRAESGEQRTESREQRTESREQRTESREQRTESREQRTESREQRTESREQRTESREHALRAHWRGAHSALREAHSALSTQHSALREAHSALREAHSALREAPSALTVLCVAQWIPRKGVLELARAWARGTRPGWRLELVGETDAGGGYEDEVRAAFAAAPGGSVAVLGTVNDAELAAVYARASLFALPSHYEGYGIAFAEALATGLPVLACAAGPVPALVGPDAGILVPPGDEEALAAALARLLDDAPLRERMGRAALARAATLPTWDECAEQFLEAVEAARDVRM